MIFEDEHHLARSLKCQIEMPNVVILKLYYYPTSDLVCLVEVFPMVHSFIYFPFSLMEMFSDLANAINEIIYSASCDDR